MANRTGREPDKEIAAEVARDTRIQALAEQFRKLDGNRDGILREGEVVLREDNINEAARMALARASIATGLAPDDARSLGNAWKAELAVVQEALRLAFPNGIEVAGTVIPAKDIDAHSGEILPGLLLGTTGPGLGAGPASGPGDSGGGGGGPPSNYK